MVYEISKDLFLEIDTFNRTTRTEEKLQLKCARINFNDENIIHLTVQNANKLLQEINKVVEGELESNKFVIEEDKKGFTPKIETCVSRQQRNEEVYIVLEVNNHTYEFLAPVDEPTNSILSKIPFMQNGDNKPFSKMVEKVKGGLFKND